MVEAWYPPGVKTAEDRLRYYARFFDTVEADSPFYAIPRRSVAEAWAARTPPGFVFHVKAFGMMTQHRVEARMLPPELRGFDFALTRTGRVDDPPQAMVERSFEVFREAVILPLQAAGKLGGVLMQFPPYFSALDEEQWAHNLAYVERALELLGGARMLVEFRHPSWVAEERASSTLRWLSDRGITYVAVDAPQFAERSTMPPHPAVTAPLAYVRLHGRNRETYFKRTASAADRFDYLYTLDELEEWAPAVHEMSAQAEETYVMFNNCRGDFAPRNARMMAEVLADEVHRHDGALPGEGPGMPESRLF